MTFKPSSHFETPCRASYQWLQREEDLLFKVDAGSEEEAEFLGLALSGVPLQAILRWCTADAQRPTSAELEGMMTGEDWRPALYMACTTGMWLCGPADASALRFLASQPQAPVEIAVR